VVLCENCHGLFHGHMEQRPEKPKTTEQDVRVKFRKPLVIPHTADDIRMPDGEGDIVLTLELVNACRANGSFTNATLNALGLCKPLVTGWVSRLLGTTISREDYRRALGGRFVYREKLRAA
jgi:hypothetical protein